MSTFIISGANFIFSKLNFQDIGRITYQYFYGEAMKIKIFKALLLVHIAAALGCQLGGTGFVPPSYALAGAAASMVLFSILRYTPIYEWTKVCALISWSFCQWAFLGPVVAQQIGLKIGFLTSSFIATSLHCWSMWLAMRWKDIRAVYVSTLVLLTWILIATHIFGGNSISWMALLFTVTISTYGYILGFNIELNELITWGSSYSDIAYAYQFYGLRVTWRTVVKQVILKFLRVGMNRLWNITRGRIV